MSRTDQPTSSKICRQPTAASESSRNQAKRPRVESEDALDLMNGKPRIRVTRACNECRKRKERCDGRRPTCEPCIRTKRECNYNPQKKRGLRTGYVRAIESLFGLLFSTVDGSEEWLFSVLFDGNEKVNAPKFRLRPHSPLQAGDSVELLLERWRKSSVASQVEQTLSHEDPQEDDEDWESSNNFDQRTLKAIKIAVEVLRQNEADHRDQSTPLSPMELEAISPVAVKHQSTATGPSLNYASNLGASLTTEDDEQASSQRPGAAAATAGSGSDPYTSNCIRLPENWSHLLDMYFAHTHCWLPLCQKHDLLRTAYVLASHSGVSKVPKQISKGDFSFLMAVLDYSCQRSGGAPFQVSGCQGNRSARPCSGPSDTLDIGDIRALLIDTLIKVQSNDTKAAWLSLGRAVYAITSMEGSLFLTSATNKASLDDGNRRTSLACIFLDTVLASSLGCRPHFRSADIATIGLLQTEGIEEWEPWQSTAISKRPFETPLAPGLVLSTFNYCVQISAILNDFLQLQETDREHVVPELIQRLHEWTPEKLLGSSEMTANKASPQILNLKMCFAYVAEVAGLERMRPSSKSTMKSNNGHLRQTLNLLEERVSSVGPLVLPSIFCLYISNTEILVKHHIGMQNQPTINVEQLQALNAFLFMQPRNEIGKRSSTTIETSKQCSSSTLYSDQTGVSAWSQSSTAEGTSLGIVRPQSLALTGPGRNFQQPSSSQRNISPVSNTLVSQQSQHILPQEFQEASQHGFGSSQGANMDLTADNFAGQTDRYGLFQGLADLDSMDWPQNPPDFLRHLGVMNDMSTDIYDFLNDDPG